MGIYDVLKDAAKALQEAGKIDSYQKILDIQSQLLDIQKRNQELEDENKVLKKKLKTKESVTYRNNAYWLKKEENKEDGPYCQRCYDKDEILMRLTPRSNNYFYCLECKNGFQIGPSEHTQRGHITFNPL